MLLLKVGGNELGDPGFVANLAHAVAEWSERRGDDVVIVHGGGKAIAALQSQLGLDPIKVDGLRVTDADSLLVAEMVLSGQSNKLIVRGLLAAGFDAIGISGVDGGLLMCQKKAHPTTDLGYVGEIVQVRVEFLRRLAGLGLTVVLSPISLGVDGLPYNVNADEVAAEVAAKSEAQELVFVSNVQGVLYKGQVLPRLTASEAEALIESGVIKDGMIPKVRGALSAVDRGVAQVRIVDLPGLAHDSGTLFVPAY